MEELAVYQAYNLYCGGMTLIEVAREMGVKSGTTILYHFQRKNLKTRPRGGAVKESQAGENNGNWKGGRCISKRKIRIWNPEHPNSDATGYVYEHALVASRALGRPLNLGEVIHHINGNPLDNRNSNLIICTQNFHAWIHQESKRRGICQKN